MSRRALLFIVTLLGILVMAPPVVYVGDALILEYRLARGGGTDALTVYFATRLKSGKLEVFTDRPQTEICARAIFPHFGYRPCWYVRRSGGVKVI
jgi:hypothetical protein